ncbi:MAG: hypothetical protein WCT20_03610 [Candidatus Babeliales bacterium]|jgi:hypothetical protein
MAFWMQDTRTIYVLRTMKTGYKALIMICTLAIMGGVFFFSYIRPLQKKLCCQYRCNASLATRKNELVKKLTALHTPSIAQHTVYSERFTSSNQCAHFFIEACTRHHLICHKVKTIIRPTKQHTNKCLIDATIDGSFVDLNALIKQLEEDASIKIKTLTIKQTSGGVNAQCLLRFFLMPESATP